MLLSEKIIEELYVGIDIPQSSQQFIIKKIKNLCGDIEYKAPEKWVVPTLRSDIGKDARFKHRTGDDWISDVFMGYYDTEFLDTNDKSFALCEVLVEEEG